MRRVLVVAYYFPPSGGPGVQRVLKMIRYLPHFGWEPVVLTVREGTFPARDDSLLAEAPPTLHIERTRILEPYKLYRRMTNTQQPIDIAVLTHHRSKSWSQRIAEWVRATLFIPDARIGWIVDAVPAGISLIKHFGISMIYTSSPPYTCALIGRALKRRSELPWVMELRDPWTGFLTTPKRWWLPAWIDRQLERSCLERADRIVVAWDGITRDALAKYPSLPSEKFVTIPNGFDAADYPPTQLLPTDKFTIAYTGSLYGLRNPALLVTALETLFAQGVLSPERVRLRLVGRIGEDVTADISRSPVYACTEFIPYRPHSESIRLLQASDVALLIVDRSSERNAIVPGKVFEYLGAGKAILALAPHGSAIEELLTETQAGVVCETAEECTSVLIDWYDRWQRNEPLVTPNFNAIARYERRNAAQQLAAQFDELVR